jgi:hypothetical protein
MSGGTARDESRGERGEWSDFDSHDRAMSASVEDVVRELTDLLGASMVAAIAGVSETRAVAQWLNGRNPQRPQVLRFALQVALMVADASDINVARAWFQGSNPHLGDRSPVAMLRDLPLTDVQADIMAAARAFARR